VVGRLPPPCGKLQLDESAGGGGGKVRWSRLAGSETRDNDGRGGHPD
jgi:hypothetical protein